MLTSFYPSVRAQIFPFFISQLDYYLPWLTFLCPFQMAPLICHNHLLFGPVQVRQTIGKCGDILRTSWTELMKWHYELTLCLSIGLIFHKSSYFPIANCTSTFIQPMSYAVRNRHYISL